MFWLKIAIEYLNIQIYMNIQIAINDLNKVRFVNVCESFLSI